MDIEIKSGDKFKTKESVYTVTNVITDILNNKTSIEWDCVGKRYWYKKVSLESIKEWISEGRLVRC